MANLGGEFLCYQLLYKAGPGCPDAWGYACTVKQHSTCPVSNFYGVLLNPNQFCPTFAPIHPFTRVNFLIITT